MRRADIHGDLAAQPAEPSAAPAAISGYRPLHPLAVEAVNVNKAKEEELLRVLDACVGDAAIDQRWLAMARTSFEIAFMQLNRAIMRPQRLALPEDSASKDLASEIDDGA